MAFFSLVAGLGAACSSSKATPKSFALEAYLAEGDRCARLPAEARAEIDKAAGQLAGNSPVSGRYRAQLTEETCLLSGLAQQIQAGATFCGELETKDRSACLSAAVRRLAERRALSYTGVTLFLAQHEEFVAGERRTFLEQQSKMGASALQLVAQRLLSGVELSRDLLLHRARPRDWIGVNVAEFERADERGARALCRQVQDMGFRYIGELRSYGNPDLDLKDSSAGFLNLDCGAI